MAELPDRATWLRAVARSLDAMPDAEAEILEEISVHLDDRVADAVARGVDPADAERRARNRLGDPAALGREIRKARRARRSALALVGGSAIALGSGTAIGAIAGFVALYLAWTALYLVDLAFADGNGASPPGAYAALVAVAIGLSLAARIVPAFIASQMRWPFATVRRVVASLIVVPGLLIALLLPNQDLDGWLAVLYPMIPVVTAAVALSAPRTGARGAWKPAAVILLALTALTYVAWPYPADAPLDIPVADPSAIGPVADFDETLAPPSGGSTGQSVDELGRQVYQQSFENMNGWHDFAVELWPLERTAAGWRFAAAPMLTVPYRTAGLNILARYHDPRPRERVWFVRVEVAMAPDGIRMVLPNAFRAEQTQPWRGTVIEWWLGR